MRSLSAKVFRKVFVRDIVLVQQRAGAGDAAGGGKATTSTTSTAGRSDDRRGDEVGKLAKRSRADTAGDRGVAAVGLPFMQRNSRVEITGVVVELEHKPRATFFSGTCLSSRWGNRLCESQVNDAYVHTTEHTLVNRTELTHSCMHRLTIELRIAPSHHVVIGAVDDGTDTILCLLWLPPPVEQQTERASSTGVASAARAYTLNLAAAEGRDEILRSIRARAKIGSVVRVQGVASVYRGSLQLRVESLRTVPTHTRIDVSCLQLVQYAKLAKNAQNFECPPCHSVFVYR